MSDLANAKEIMDAQPELIRKAHATLQAKYLREFGMTLAQEFETKTLQAFSVGVKFTHQDITKRVDSYLDFKSKQKENEG
jgi:hypothetical protein